MSVDAGNLPNLDAAEVSPIVVGLLILGGLAILVGLTLSFKGAVHA